MPKGATLAAPFRLVSCHLEVELQSKLNQPWVSGCGNTSEVGVADVSVRITEVSMVEDVEELGAELKDLVLTDSGALHHRKVEDDVARSVENITTEVTEPARTRIQVGSRSDSTEEGIRGSGGTTSTSSIK